MHKKILAAIIYFFTLMQWLAAQPTDAEIKKQITNAGTKSIKFTKTTGTRQWNSDIGNWEWVRGVEIIRKSDYPGIDLLVVGDVVYQYTGAGKYSYWKFRTISNQYFGIPNPSAADINTLLSQDWAKFYGYYFQKITKLYYEPVLADEPAWTWHTPNSVEFKMKLKFDHIISYTEVETIETIWNVRLYRDDPKAAWKNFLASRSNNDPDTKKIGVQTYTSEQVRDFEKQTLAFTINEKIAREKAASLPNVEVPAFASPREMVDFLHNLLRNGTPEQFEAVLLQVFSPNFFVEGSSTQLTAQAKQLIASTITTAWKNKATYKQQYCQNYLINQSLSSKSHIYVLGCINNVASVFGVQSFNMGYVEGVPQIKWKLTELRVGVRQDQDAIDYINSFSDRKKLCPND
jgi:hypothetical protein